MSACHAGRLADNPTPVGSAIMPKTREESWACLFPLPLLSVKRAGGTHSQGNMLGRKIALLAQLRLPMGTSSKSILVYMRILFSAPHSLPFSSARGTDVSGSQYKGSLLT